MKKAMTTCDLSDSQQHASQHWRQRPGREAGGNVAAASVMRRISPLIVCAVFALAACGDKPDAGTAPITGSTSDAASETVTTTPDTQASTSVAMSDAATAQAAASEVEAAASDVKTAASKVLAASSSVDTAASDVDAAAADVEAAAADVEASVSPTKAAISGATSDTGARERSMGERAHPGAAKRQARGDAVAPTSHTVGADAEASAQNVAIPFGFDAATFSPVHARLLDSVVATLLLDPARHAILSGHADRHGAAAYNRTLARARADAVRDHLLGRGVAAAQLTVRSDAEDVERGAIAKGPARRVDVMLRARGDQG